MQSSFVLLNFNYSDRNFPFDWPFHPLLHILYWSGHLMQKSSLWHIHSPYQRRLKNWIDTLDATWWTTKSLLTATEQLTMASLTFATKPQEATPSERELRGPVFN